MIAFNLALEGSTTGVRRVRTYIYFYWRTDDFGHLYVDTYAHFLVLVILTFKSLLLYI